MTAAEAFNERDRVLAEVETAKRRVIDAGLDVLRRYAAAGRPFSANDVREQLRAVGVESASTGALFNAAIKAKLIRRVGWETSTDVGTHAKPVARYIAAGQRTPLEALTVPVVRDNGGRFTNNDTPSGAVPLFDLTPEGTHP